MNDKENRRSKIENQKTTHLAAVLRLKDLPGRVRKYLEVPAGRTGVAVSRSGRPRTFPAGRHKLVGFLGRLSGRGVGLQAGYVPEGPFSAVLPAGYLLSGDEELLSARLYLNAQVADPARFFSSVVLQRGAIPPGLLVLEDESFSAVFRSLARKYLAADLVGERLTPRLLTELNTAVTPALTQAGLTALGGELPAVWRASEDLRIAQERSKLSDQLDAIELERRMSQVQNQAELQGFVDQFESETGIRIGLPASGATPGAFAQIRGRVGEIVLDFLTEEAVPETGRRRLKLLRLFDRAEREKFIQDTLPQVRRTPSTWWLPRSVLIFFLIFVTVMGSLLITRLGASWLDQLGFLLPFWGLMVTFFLESIYKLYQKREEIEERSWTLPGYTQIDNLVRYDRPRADQLVRQECARELGLMRDTLNDLRGRVYRQGDEDLALKIRSLEHKLETTIQQKILALDFGKPPYLTDLKVSRRSWDGMLDYDENLLLYLSAISEKTGLVQQKYPGSDLRREIDQLETEVDRFVHRFAGRARPLQPPQENGDSRKNK